MGIQEVKTPRPNIYWVYSTGDVSQADTLKEVERLPGKTAQFIDGEPVLPVSWPEETRNTWMANLKKSLARNNGQYTICGLFNKKPSLKKKETTVTAIEQSPAQIDSILQAAKPSKPALPSKFAPPKHPVPKRDPPPKERRAQPVPNGNGDLAAEAVPFENEEAWGEWIKESPAMKAACEDFGFYKMIRGNGQLEGFRNSVESEVEAVAEDQASETEWSERKRQAEEALRVNPHDHVSRQLLKAVQHF